MQKTRKQKGFTLIEVLISIFVITIGVVAGLNLLSSVVGSVAINKSQVIATNLSQEGLEIVRNIRDTNWQEDDSWDNGLSAGEYRAEYNSDSLLPLSDNPPLQISSDSLYQYGSGDDTIFHRKIIIENITNGIEVTSKVTWSQRGKSFEASAISRLYDWR